VTDSAHAETHDQNEVIGLIDNAKELESLTVRHRLHVLQQRALVRLRDFSLALPEAVSAGDDGEISAMADAGFRPVQLPGSIPSA
jgi:hypothetical protein